MLLAPALGLLPAVLRPLMSGADSYSDAETNILPEELQLLEPSAARENDARVLTALLETLLVLTGTREERERLREVGCYYVVRECHLAVEDEGVREACDRLVQVLMRNEEGERSVQNHGSVTAAGGGSGNDAAGRMVTGAIGSSESEDDDNKVVEIF